MRNHAFVTIALAAACLGGGALGALSCSSAAMAQVAAPAPDRGQPTPPLVRTLTAAQAQQDVALMRRALETIHPGLYRRAGKARIEAAFAALERAVRQPISELDLYRRVSLMLAEIRCNHTKAEQTQAIEAWRRDNPSHLPFRFRLLEGRMIVDSSDPAQPALPRGTEILSINGRSVASLVRTLGAYVPIDGDTVWSRATNLAADGDLMGSDFDHFYPYVFGFAEAFDLTVRDGEQGARRTVRMAPLSFKEWLTLPWSGAGYRNNFSDSTRWRMVDAQTAYLRVETFMNYRKPVDARAYYAQIFDEIHAAGAQRLILDLRDNGGGSGDATYTLMDFLAPKAFVWNRAIRVQALRIGDLADAIETWGDRTATFFPPLENFTAVAGGGFDFTPATSPEELLPRQPAPNAFTGPVTVLTSPVNASGSTMLIAKLRDLGRVRLVGERSGGSGDGPTAGRIYNVTLPNSGIAVRVPNAFNAMQVRRFEREGGVTPDVLAAPSVAAFRANRDIVLEAALADRGAPPMASPSPDAAPILRRLAGVWRGTLEYRDFSSDQRVTLPTTLDATLTTDAQAVSFAFTYDDGPGKTVRGGYTVSLDLGEEILSKAKTDGAELFRLTRARDPSSLEGEVLQLWGRGNENDAPVDVRETLTIAPNRLTLLRETRPKDAAFAFRHVYTLDRVVQ